MKHLAILLIRAYQLCIAPLIGETCRFYPSCSHYGLESFQKHGFLKGAWLTMKRIVKCGPWHPGGPDHVP